jgi:hypothetical protein
MEMVYDESGIDTLQAVHEFQTIPLRNHWSRRPFGFLDHLIRIDRHNQTVT